jgi:hypothetical protein
LCPQLLLAYIPSRSQAVPPDPAAAAVTQWSHVAEDETTEYSHNCIALILSNTLMRYMPRRLLVARMKRRRRAKSLITYSLYTQQPYSHPLARIL